MRHPTLTFVILWTIGCSAHAEMPSAWVPVLENPGFEQASSAVSWFDYSTSNAVAGEVTSSRSRTGQRSYRFQAQSSKAYQGLAQKVPVQPGLLYAITAYVVNDAANPLAGPCHGQFRLEWKNAAGETIGAVATPAWDGRVPASSWKQITAEGEAPTDAVYAHAVIALTTRGPGAKGRCYVDDIVITAPALVPVLENSGFENPQVVADGDPEPLPDDWFDFTSDDDQGCRLVDQQMLTGLQCLYLTAPAGTDGFHGVAQRFPVIPGHTYVFSAHVRNHPGQPLSDGALGQLGMEWQKDNHVEIDRWASNPWSSSLSTDRWTEVSVRGKAPEGAAYGVATITAFTDEEEGGGSFCVDDAKLIRLAGEADDTTRSRLPAQGSGTANAFSHSIQTKCAEHDNVNIPLYGSADSFVIEATQPRYPVRDDNCDADFANCPTPFREHKFQPAVYKLYDDNVFVFEAVRETLWRLSYGMRVYVDNGEFAENVHYVRLYRKISDKENDWPQVYVMYMDGNLRLVPFPPRHLDRSCLGSSVLIGSAAVEKRPIAEIAYMRFLPHSKSLRVVYKHGGSALLTLEEASRHLSRVRVDVDYPADTQPFVTFRSMFVAEDNCDSAYVSADTTDAELSKGMPIMEFEDGASDNWLFFRKEPSRHNTSAPDIGIRLLH